ncbi:tail protein [Bacillus phage vB_BmeM-Goe8]|uniref:Uncharacterized protein n=1 Tax=Bacillus phage vB_BmeM-Goe8 TaxID=2593638 RepID=A0A516KMQ9_9CAUD|nr:tail protein [Bacillus phage vB_BmeM-Goe8]QDP42865.1 hypothetical protein Goe8_c00920 [Bacillus phage vB_BmeM-Goe8]
MSLATAQITLTDLNDVRQYMLFANGNYKTQIYDPNNTSYTPSFSSSNLVITPELYVSGGDGSNLLPSNQVKSVKWYEGTQTDTPLAETTSGTTGNGFTYSIPTGAVTSTAKSLSIKSNIPSNITSQIYTCVVVYTDTQTNFDVTIKAQYEIVKVSNGTTGSTGGAGTDAYFLNLWTPNGDTIRNSSGEILLQADLYKGSGKVTPTAFKWYIQDPTATTTSNGDTDGGDGWRLIKTVATATTAPTLAQVANANTKLTAGTYYVKYTWLGQSGETLGSTEASLAVAAGNDLKVTIPAFPTNAIGAKVYIGTASGVLKYAGDISTSAGNVVINRYDASNPAIPTVNTATAVTSATLTVKPHAISGIEGFKVVATAPTTNIKYSGVIMVKDVQDQIQANVLGSSIFKNGEGSTVLTVQLIQAGTVISNAGYKFTWALYNPNGSLVKTYPTTADTLTVPSTDVSGVGNLIVDVDKA